ncbi:hypothetical protein EDD11_000097 [Mortierella claussenii]|nr:hypothetical protein EDD11_000097 [Mortierella claussenii]
MQGLVRIPTQFLTFIRSEYWKSNAKYWCRFCKLYITDNKSTRNIHDAGSKHKENVERFLREQNQRGREKEAETAKLNKQMEAIEKAAMKQYQLDVEAGLVKPSVGSLPFAAVGASAKEPATSSPAPRLLAVTPSPAAEPVSGTAPSTEKTEEATTAAAEPKGTLETTETTIATAPKDETVGQPGEWQTVEVPLHRSRPSEDSNSRDGVEKRADDGSHYVEGADDEGGADPEDLRGFKIVEKTYPVEADVGEENESGSGSAVFKKRKAGATKPRNIRRKL